MKRTSQQLLMGKENNGDSQKKRSRIDIKELIYGILIVTITIILPVLIIMFGGF